MGSSVADVIVSREPGDGYEMWINQVTPELLRQLAGKLSSIADEIENEVSSDR